EREKRNGRRDGAPAFRCEHRRGRYAERARSQRLTAGTFAPKLAATVTDERAEGSSVMLTGHRMTIVDIADRLRLPQRKKKLRTSRAADAEDHYDIGVSYHFSTPW